MRMRDRAWVWFLGLGLLALVPYPWLPADGLWQSVWYDSIATLGVLAMAAGIRRNRPAAAPGWWLLAAGQLCNVVGDAIYFVYFNVLGDDLWPAPYDVPYLGSYVLMVAGILVLLRRRNRGRDQTSLVDSLTIAGAFALLTWVFLMKPVAHDASLGLGAQLVAISYPSLDLLVLAMLAWLLTSEGPRNVAFALVAVNMLGFLVGDYLWAFAQQTLYDPGQLSARLIDLAYLTAYVAFGAAALHPGMVEIGKPVPPGPVRPMSALRLVFLTGATLIAPALLAWQATTGDGRVLDAYAIVLGCVTMFLLVVTRMVLLVRQVQGQAVVLEEQAARLREVAQRDPLTGLPNRRAWNAALPPALLRAARDGAPLALAVIDLDYFKAFNDTYGHLAGDRLLKEAAAVWTGNLRAVDLLARYGGEEFVALLPGADVRQAIELVDRLRPLTPMGRSFSAGVAVWDGAEAAEGLLARADRAMYAAKSAGRGRTVADHPAHPLPA